MADYYPDADRAWEERFEQANYSYDELERDWDEVYEPEQDQDCEDQ
jgi:hypothetical protein